MHLNLEKSPFFKEISLKNVNKVHKAHSVGKTLVLMQQLIDEVILWDRITTKRIKCFQHCHFYSVSIANEQLHAPDEEEGEHNGVVVFDELKTLE